ncbi:unnamed protein product [Periconia digitata]|uniref:Uncharacterized protein n=1 Tax=Periconia digitata TaxID=1303443 RepID=A0A9W4U8K1_9PLEO|nr:unnamed protein product [Periconia digitata]
MVDVLVPRKRNALSILYSTVYARNLTIARFRSTPRILSPELKLSSIHAHPLPLVYPSRTPDTSSIRASFLSWTTTILGLLLASTLGGRRASRV